MTPKKTQETSLLWPFLIIGLGIIISMSFVLIILKSHKKPRPLVIKPSSVESFEDVALALYKAMYPLTKQGYNFQVTPKISETEKQLAKEINKYFPKIDSEKTVSINLVEVDLSSKASSPSQLFTCHENNFFNLYRKKEKKWKKNIYFSICKERENTLILSFSQK